MSILLTTSSPNSCHIPSDREPTSAQWFLRHCWSEHCVTLTTPPIGQHRKRLMLPFSSLTLLIQIPVSFRLSFSELATVYLKISFSEPNLVLQVRSGLIYSFLPSFSRNIFDQCQTTLGSVQSKEECSVLLLRTRYIFGDCPRSNSFWFLRVYGQLALLSSFPWTPIVVCVLSSTKLFLCVGSLPYLCESPSCHRGPGRGGGCLHRLL